MSVSFEVTILKDLSLLHIEVITSTVLVSTIYNLQSFIINVSLSDEELNPISGWINITIGNENYIIYCDSAANTTFQYYPQIAGDYILQAIYGGDAYHEDTIQEVTGLTANLRSVTYETDFPSIMTATIDTNFDFFDVYDDEFLGIFQDTTYIRDYPINASLSIWWTLSPDYEGPRNYVNTWDIIQGTGIATWALPWDLDGDKQLTNDDFECYLQIQIDGLDVYEDTIINMTIKVVQLLEFNLEIPTLIFSDPALLTLQLYPLYDSSFTSGLSLNVDLFISNDNSTWTLIDTITTNTNGWANKSWICNDIGTFYFKGESLATLLYAESIVYNSEIVNRENTILTIEFAENFTYSDQGMVVVRLNTDDNESIVGYSVYLEIMDSNWISIGSGATNESGYVNILWVPTLPSGEYLIQVRAPLTESQYYEAAVNAMGQLNIGKEIIIITIDSTTVAEGYILAKVTDDENNPFEDIPVSLYVDGEVNPRAFAFTDNEGYVQLTSTFTDGQRIKIVVNESSYYHGAIEEINITVPPNVLVLTIAAGSTLAVAIGLAVGRKTIRARLRTGPEPLSSEISKALEEERELIPERVREHSERQLAELDELSGDELISEPEEMPSDEIEEVSPSSEPDSTFPSESESSVDGDD
jgi:hypothetical protein